MFRFQMGKYTKRDMHERHLKPLASLANQSQEPQADEENGGQLPKSKLSKSKCESPRLDYTKSKAIFSYQEQMLPRINALKRCRIKAARETGWTNKNSENLLKRRSPKNHKMSG